MTLIFQYLLEIQRIADKEIKAVSQREGQSAGEL